MRGKIKNLQGWRHLLLAAVLFAAALFFKLALVGYTALAVGFFLAALVVLAYYILKLMQERHPKGSKFLNRMLSYGLILFLMLFAITVGAIAGDANSELPENAEIDYVIVLGAGVNGTVPSRVLTWRLEAALTYLQENPEVVCIVSGGQGPGEDITEAQCMRIWLEARGIAADRIWMEEASTSTAENLLFSKAIIDARDGESAGIAVITSEFHVMRAKMMANRLGLETYGLAAETKLPLLRINYFFREVFALWKYLVLG